MNNNEIDKYPIKYAAMPVISTAWGYDGFGDKEFRLGGYIVSKCYVIKEIKNYHNLKKEYEIVFPVEEEYRSVPFMFNGNKGMLPKWHGNECTNSVVCDKIFSDYDEASKYVEKLNFEFVKWDRPTPKELEENLKQHEKWEKEQQELTAHMKVNKKKNKKIRKLIK